MADLHGKTLQINTPPYTVRYFEQSYAFTMDLSAYLLMCSAVSVSFLTVSGGLRKKFPQAAIPKHLGMRFHGEEFVEEENENTGFLCEPNLL